MLAPMIRDSPYLSLLLISRGSAVDRSRMRGSSVSEAKVVSLPQDHNLSLWLLEIAAPVKLQRILSVRNVQPSSRTLSVHGRTGTGKSCTCKEEKPFINLWYVYSFLHEMFDGRCIIITSNSFIVIGNTCPQGLA